MKSNLKTFPYSDRVPIEVFLWLEDLEEGLREKLKKWYEDDEYLPDVDMILKEVLGDET